MTDDENRRSDSTTSSGMALHEVPEQVREHVEWIDGVHGVNMMRLPTIAELPCPEILFSLPRLADNRPRGSKAMLDHHGAKSRLKDQRPGAWLISPFTGWSWAVWPSGDVGWLPPQIELPRELRVRARNDTL